MGKVKSLVDDLINTTLEWADSPQFYAQCGLIILSIILSFSISNLLRRHAALLTTAPEKGAFYLIRKVIYQIRDLLFPLITIITLSAAVELSMVTVQQSWLVRIAQSLVVILILYSIIKTFVRSGPLKILLKWIGIPVALLQVFGWLDDVVAFLDSIDIIVGNIRISLYGLVRVVIFGFLLFWLGRISNSAGQQIIRNQEELDAGTREVFAKLFEVVLFIVIVILFLQIMGINLTALAVFGGALGVGLGFGLQAIASNFISGIIILLDRSVTVGDYIELEDGVSGTIREMNMRSTTLETFDGKDIMVPNENFITKNLINWTHKNRKQRYSLEFAVAYKTDLHALFKLVREVVASHPQVLSDPSLPVEELPDAEILSFGDFGINILVEFWMEGIDDGRNKVGADLMLMIWDALKENGIEIPFPQREIRILDKDV